VLCSSTSPPPYPRQRKDHTAENARPDLEWIGLLLIPFLGILLLAFYFLGAFFPPCPFRSITGLPCVSCGMTRASYALLSGDLWAAWRLNPLALFLPVLAFATWSYSLAVVVGLWAPLRQSSLSPSAWLTLRLGLVFIVSANWIYLLSRA